jgi:hypothetical protein
MTPKLTAAQQAAYDRLKAGEKLYAYNGVNRATIAVLQRRGLASVEWTVSTGWNRRSGRAWSQGDWAATLAS